MANTERYRFDVDADTSKAVAKLKEITQLMDKIDKVHSKGQNDYSTINQKDMDQSMRSMSQLSKAYKDMERDLTDIQRKMQDMASKVTVPVGATEEQKKGIREVRQAYINQAQEAIKQQKALRNELIRR